MLCLSSLAHIWYKKYQITEQRENCRENDDGRILTGRPTLQKLQPTSLTEKRSLNLYIFYDTHTVLCNIAIVMRYWQQRRCHEKYACINHSFCSSKEIILYIPFPMHLQSQRRCRRTCPLLVSHLGWFCTNSPTTAGPLERQLILSSSR
jgi:hypothetical protein